MRRQGLSLPDPYAWSLHTGHNLAPQGHRNAVSCLDAPADRSLMVSADAGPGDCMLIGWDTEIEQACWTVAEPHPRGVAAMAVSGDGRTLATLSAVPPGGCEQQEVSLQA